MACGHGGPVHGPGGMAGREAGTGRAGWPPGPEPHSAPALAEPAPALTAVKVRDQFGIDQTVQFRQCEASGPLDVATDRHRERIEVVCHLRHNRSVLHSQPVAY